MAAQSSVGTTRKNGGPHRVLGHHQSIIRHDFCQPGDKPKDCGITECQDCGRAQNFHLSTERLVSFKIVKNSPQANHSVVGLISSFETCRIKWVALTENLLPLDTAQHLTRLVYQRLIEQHWLGQERLNYL